NVRPVGLGLRLLQRCPVTIGLQPPLQHELGLVLLGRDHADDVLVQPLGDFFLFDIGDEAPLVLAVRQVLNCIYISAHCILPEIGPILTSFPCASLMAASCSGCTRSASIRSSSAPLTALLMICWLVRMGQRASKSHSPITSVLHSVSAMGPSRAAIISATVISRAGLARL